MDPSHMDPAKVSTCTSCTFAEDMSNYWTASLYFKSPENGTFRRVPQMANSGLVQDGGITVYYMQPFGGKATITAFKPVGFPPRLTTTPTNLLLKVIPPGLPYGFWRLFAAIQARNNTGYLPPVQWQWGWLCPLRQQGHFRISSQAMPWGNPCHCHLSFLLGRQEPGQR
jgi:hypothetical protein